MSHFHDSEYEDNCLLGCDAVYSGMQVVKINYNMTYYWGCC